MPKTANRRTGKLRLVASPDGRDGSVLDAPETLKAVRKLDFDVALPGHRALIPGKASLDAAIAMVKAERIESVAVCLLHAYANPEHERILGAELKKRLPGSYVSLSNEILREYREYERTSTAVLNAYVGTQVSTYLRALEQPLTKRGFDGNVALLQSPTEVHTFSLARLTDEELQRELKSRFSQQESLLMQLVAFALIALGAIFVLLTWTFRDYLRIFRWRR